MEPVPRTELLCKTISRRQVYATPLFRWHLILVFELDLIPLIIRGGTVGLA